MRQGKDKTVEGDAGSSQEAPRDRDELRGLAQAYMRSRVLLTAVELDLFRHFESGRRAAAEIAADLRLDARAVEILLNAMSGMGLLRKEGDGFAIREELAPFLVPGEPDYQGPILQHLSEHWKSWSLLTEVVRQGHPGEGEGEQPRSRFLAQAMQQYASEAAPAVARLVDCSTVGRLVDLGGGPGSFSIAFAQRYPQLAVVLIDNDADAVRVAGSTIERCRLEDRIAVRKADFMSDDIGSDYDLAFLSSVLCVGGEDQNTLLLERVNRALNSGGRVVIRDWMLSDDKTLPSAAALFSVNMLVNTPRGRVYSDRELRRWLKRAGFQRTHRVPTSSLPMMIGAK